ncbi:MULTISPECIES: hypothetical protein [unclassified Thioalkalivibrio]|uniref:phage nozzle protein n=1 Tax=unclassified Thioalkalivibrio TaxID=2621013 RepID=UPI00035DE6BD|nr:MULTISPECIES: hypothetical protein [unclassified Thioalkalivibrio]
MSLVSTTIPNLINGVSQQPTALRLASHGTEQINGYSSVVEGLGKRPGTRHVSRLEGAVDAAFMHTINRDTQEQYVVMIQDGDLKVWDLNGVPQTVNFPDGKSYLNAANPELNFRCVTVADYTFVLNTTVVADSATDLSATRNPEALIFVRQGSYGARYLVRVDGTTVADYRVPDGSNASHATSVTTDNIATQLRSQMLDNLGSGWNITRYGSTLWVRRSDGGSFTIRSEDSLGDSGMTVIAQATQRFSDLPARAVNGYTVEITGDQSSSFDNYFVEYDDTRTGQLQGVWNETLKGGERYRLDRSTMPHGLIREADGTFTFRRLDWDDRNTGDLDSNPFPSFVGHTINDIFFHRNRLGVVSGENIIMSRAGEFFNFFARTATAVMDDDPIDVGVSHTKVSILRHAIPFNQTLLLFSDQTQFQLGSADVLTASTISVNQTTEYEASLLAKPVGAGRYIYFAVNRGTHTGIREYYVDGAIEAEDAREVTAHVPKYIPGRVHKLASSTNEDILVALTHNAPNEIFVYRYYWSSEDKLQASWSRWRFSENDKILNCDFIESRLYLLIAREDGVHLEIANLEPGNVVESCVDGSDLGMGIPILLDSLVGSTCGPLVEYEEEPEDLNGGRPVTHITLPYRVLEGDNVQLVTGKGGFRAPGKVIHPIHSEDINGSTRLTFDGDWVDQPFFIGKPYEFRYRFSHLTIKEEAPGGGQMTIGEGRLQIRKMNLLFNRTGYFRAEVTPFNRDTYTYVMSRVLGSANNMVNTISVEEGNFTFPVASKNDKVTIEIVNDTYLPSWLLSAEWEAYYTIRSRRI